MGNRIEPDEFHPMTPRKRLEGALAEWHPHPKNANNSLVPVVRNAAPADDIADRFFDSAPQGYMPELPPAVEVADVGKASTRRAALHSAAARERRRYLTRYVAGAVGLAAVIGLGALVRVSVTRDASAAQAPTRPASFNAASEALPEPLSPPPIPPPPRPAPRPIPSTPPNVHRRTRRRPTCRPSRARPNQPRPLRSPRLPRRLRRQIPTRRPPARRSVSRSGPSIEVTSGRRSKRESAPSSSILPTPTRG